MKILITGGHVTPALAIIEELQRIGGHEVVFVGRKYPLDSENTLSLEFKEIEKRGIKFISLPTGRLARIISFASLKNAIRIPLGIIRAYEILRVQKPDVILSFGGYIAFPIALVGYFLGIAVYTHEQTIRPGLANRLIGKVAKSVFISFDGTQKYFSKDKVIVAGNPIRRFIFEVHSKPFEVSSGKKVIYVTGGSLGSHSINVHIGRLLKDLLKKYIVIHQTGDTKEYNDFEKLTNQRFKLPAEMRKNYILRKHFFEDEIGYVYSMSDLVIGRAGANTFFELLALEKPVLFIPLPWSANHEQQHQAQIFKDNGVGEVFIQSGRSDELIKVIEKMLKNIDRYKNNFARLKFMYKQDATNTILSEILKGTASAELPS